MSELHVYSVDSEEWWIAEDFPDLMELIVKNQGCDHGIEEIIKCDDNALRSIRVNTEGRIISDDMTSEEMKQCKPLTLTNKEWAIREGRGYLVGNNW